MNPRPEQSAAQPPTGDALVRIEKPIYGGASLARVDGKAVFVPLTLPGEEARIRIVESKKGYSTAEALEITSPAPERTAPRCPHFGRCGGCHYQHASYEAQLTMKQAILRETLTRAGVSAPAEIATLSADPWGYRNRIRLAFDQEGRPGYRGERSHQVVALEECPIAAPLLVKAAHAVGEIARSLQLAPRLRELALFCNHDESSLLASLTVADGTRLRFDDFAQALNASIPELAGAELLIEERQRGRMPSQSRRAAAWGAPSLFYRVGGFDYRVDHGSFFQGNRFLLDAFVECVTGARAGDLAWDLYAGVGLFARQLSANFARVVAVESAPSAAPALTDNLKGSCGEAIRASTLDFLRGHRSAKQPDLVVVDPPRTGLGAQVCELLGKTASPQMIYVSCDPATLARDLRLLTDSGYRIESLTLADLFPQTFHMETVAALRRS
jgi:23S rRNA (uracil1939-C5)-methyltransferase